VPAIIGYFPVTAALTREPKLPFHGLPPEVINLSLLVLSLTTPSTSGLSVGIVASEVESRPAVIVSLIASSSQARMSNAMMNSLLVTNVVATITALEAQAAASLFLSDDRFLASSPKLDGAANVWRVPVLLAYPIIGPVGRTGEILVNAASEEIISYTPLEEMKATARKLYEQNRDAIEAPVP